MARRASAAKVAEAQAGLMAFLASAGMEVEEEVVASAFDVDGQKYVPREHEDVPMLQAEGVLLYAQNAARNFMPKYCKECKEVFSTMYINVAYCSSLCRGTAMKKRMGIEWDYSKDHYRLMDVDRPLVVGPQAYSVLLEMARRILDNHQILENQPEKAELPPANAWLVLDEPSEESAPNLPEADTIPEQLPPSLDHPSSSDDPLGFGPAPF